MAKASDTPHNASRFECYKSLNPLIYIIRCKEHTTRLLKAGANAGAGRQTSKSLGVAMTSLISGRGDSASWGTNSVFVTSIGGEIHTRGTHAVILAFYPGSDVLPNPEGTAKNR